MAKNLTNFQKRCEDCACLIVQNGKWLCDECFSCPIEEVDECPEGITLEEVQEIEDKTKGVKIDHGAKSDKPKEKKSKTVKISNEKTEIFEYLTDFLPKQYDITVIKANKLIEIAYNGKKFKLDLIETREKKK